MERGKNAPIEVSSKMLFNPVLAAGVLKLLQRVIWEFSLIGVTLMGELGPYGPQDTLVRIIKTPSQRDFSIQKGYWIKQNRVRQRCADLLSTSRAMLSVFQVLQILRKVRSKYLQVRFMI